MALRLASRQARLVVFGYNAVTARIGWVKSPPSPQYAGSPLTLAGGQVMAYYKDGTASDITEVCGYEPEEGALLEYGGELNINANYTDHAGNQFTADTKIDVADVETLLFTSLSRTTQKEGYGLDLSGAALSARYSDGTTRTVDASSVTFEPAAGEILGHTDKQSIQAVWKNPATGSEYYAEYTITVDTVDGIYFSHEPNKKDYAEGEPLDLTGVVIALKYKLSGDIEIVTDFCTFYPESGSIMSPYATSLHAYYERGDVQGECETLLNVQAVTVPISEVGRAIGEELGLVFTDDLPADFWDDYGFQDVPCIPADGDYYLTEDNYSGIVDYLARKGAFDKYERNGKIKFLKVPAGTYYSADGKHSVTAKSDLFFVAAVKYVNGNPTQLLPTSAVEYPYTNKSSIDQCYVYNFTMNSADLTENNPVSSDRAFGGILGSLNGYLHMKPAGVQYPDRPYDADVYSDNTTIAANYMVNVPGIMNLPWVWYEDIPHSIAELRALVYGAEHEDGCTGITHKGKILSLTYSKGSLYEEVKEQFPELFESNVTYGGTEYVHVQS